MKKRSYIGLALGALVVVGAVLSLPSCGNDKKLVNLTIQPATQTFLTPEPGLTEQYTAIGSYIHPPSTQDVTSRATWKVDNGVVTMNAGLVSPAGGLCGVANISASLPEGTGGASNIVIGYATVTVDNPLISTCPGGGRLDALSVQVFPTGFGTVTGSTSGINCPGQCIALIPVGASVGLTAVPASGHSLLSWTGCDTSSGNDCTVTIPPGGINVLAQFQ